MQKSYHHLALSIFLMLLCACGGATSTGTTVPIRLQYAARVGQRVRLRVQSTASKNLTFFSANRVLRSTQEHMVTEFVGIHRVVRANENGSEIEGEYIIESLTRDRDAGPQTLVSPGEVLSVTTAATAATATLTFASGLPVTPEIRDALGDVILLRTRTGNADDVFGIATAQAVGASWPVNAEAAARDARQSGIELEAANVSGTVQLRGLTERHSIPCLDLVADMRTTNFPIPGVPAGSTTVESAMTMHYESLESRTEASPDLYENESTALSGTVELGGEAGRPTRLVLAFSQDKVTSREPL